MGKKGGTKFVIIALIIIGLVGAFFLGKKLLFSKEDEENLDMIFDPHKPIVVENNGKYGYITSEGKVMIDPKYNKANDFHGDYAVVLVDNPDTTSYNDEIYQIIDKKGNVKISSESLFGPSYYSKYGIWVVDGILYDSKLNKVLSDEIKVDYISDGYLEFVNNTTDESGIINYKGKVVFKWAGTSISAEISSMSKDTDEVFAAVRSYGNPERDVVVSLKTGDILFNVENAEDNYLTEEDDGIFRYYNQSDKDGYNNKTWLYFYNNKLAYKIDDKVDEMKLYDYENQILEIDYGYNYEKLGKTKRRYYYDVKNKKMLDEKPELSTSDVNLNVNLTELTYGYKEYSCSGKYGLMSGENVVIPCEYNDIEYLNSTLFKYLKSKGQELFYLEKDKKTIVMNIKNEKLITTLDSTYVYDYDDSTFVKVTLYEENGYTTKGYLIYNLLTGKSMEFSKNDKISINSNYVTCTKDNKKYYYNTDFKEIYVGDIK